MVDVQNAHMMCTSCYVASSYNTNDDKSGCMSIIEVLEDEKPSYSPTNKYLLINVYMCH